MTFCIDMGKSLGGNRGKDERCGRLGFTFASATTLNFMQRTTTTLLLILCLCLQGMAQSKGPSMSVRAGRGISFASADSSFTLALNGRIQSLFEAKNDLAGGPVAGDFLLRRCRLNVQGQAFHPSFSYRIQIGFAHGDITAANSSSQNNLILRDAMLFYSPARWLRIGFGQTKLPGNRQRMVSSANLQLVERSVVNNNFTLDRDKGIWLYTNFKLGSSVLKVTGAVSSGEGRITSNANGELCYSGRAEWMPFGEFSGGGDLIESDLEREKKPKLGIAAAYSYNQGNVRTLGQLGDFLHNGSTSDIHYYGGDIMFKYRGFSLEGEYYTRRSSLGIIANSKDTTQKNYVLSGTGYFVQTGYLFTPRDEVAARIGFIEPEAKLMPLAKSQREYVLGYSHYFFRHNLKLQTDVTYAQIGTQELLTYRLNGVITF